MILFYKFHTEPQELYGGKIYKKKLPLFVFNKFCKNFLNKNRKYLSFTEFRYFLLREILWASNGETAWTYAKYIINSQFERGHEAIWNWSQEHWCIYAVNFKPYCADISIIKRILLSKHGKKIAKILDFFKLRTHIHLDDMDI